MAACASKTKSKDRSLASLVSSYGKCVGADERSEAAIFLQATLINRR
jgi:hypothetical protein